MKTLFSGIKNLLLLHSVVTRLLAFSLVFISAGLVVIQPCAGQDGTWITTGSLLIARRDHTATLLPNGKVLVAGGVDESGHGFGTAELYDPATGTWTASGSLAKGRWSHTATLLPDGQVLVAGGWDNGYLASADLYDPARDTWRATGRLATARYGHTATLLPNGQVLVAGGVNVGELASAELYDPASETWTATGSLNTARYFHTATLLPNGKVLAAGGTPDNIHAFASSELYDSSGSPTPTPTPAPITLSAAGRKVNGVDTVRLTWSGATSSQVDIYRCDQHLNGCNPAVIATTVNDGRYFDSTGQTGEAGFRYRVCEAGTQTCSNTEGVTF